MPTPDRSLETTVGPLTLKNPFLLASGPPTASGEQIRHAFRLGWAGAVTKTIVPDAMEISQTSTLRALRRSRAAPFPASERMHPSPAVSTVSPPWDSRNGARPAAAV